jgi:hypothetical protein
MGGSEVIAQQPWSAEAAKAVARRLGVEPLVQASGKKGGFHTRA